MHVLEFDLWFYPVLAITLMLVGGPIAHEIAGNTGLATVTVVMAAILAIPIIKHPPWNVTSEPRR
jgi:hypothetical protein